MVRAKFQRLACTFAAPEFQSRCLSELRKLSYGERLPLELGPAKQLAVAVAGVTPALAPASSHQPSLPGRPFRRVVPLCLPNAAATTLKSALNVPGPSAGAHQPQGVRRRPQVSEEVRRAPVPASSNSPARRHPMLSSSSLSSSTFAKP